MAQRLRLHFRQEISPQFHSQHSSKKYPPYATFFPTIYSCFNQYTNNTYIIITLYIQMLQAQSETVKLIITFPPQTHIQDLVNQLRDQYGFIQDIKKVSSEELFITFDSMTELLQINFVEEFQATRIKFQNSDSFCKVMRREGLCSSDDEEMSSCSLKQKINCSTQSEINGSDSLPRIGRMERLTSLEDEVVQVQKLREKFMLFDYQESLELYGIQEQEPNDKVQAHEEEPSELKENVWIPLVSGVVITSLIVGGIKILRSFFS